MTESGHGRVGNSSSSIIDILLERRKSDTPDQGASPGSGAGEVPDTKADEQSVLHPK
jgi:hypothetical protein